MSAFRKFGIERLSPSALNCWITTPGLWCLRYLAGARDDGSPAAWRGSAVENGLRWLLMGKTFEEALSAAGKDFDAKCQGELSDAISAEAKLIPGMMVMAQSWHQASVTDNMLAPLAATQLKVETMLDGVSIPVIGYLDFTFMEGADVDCKTTKACPSKPKADHVRQLSLYWHARQRPQALLYLTEKKFAYYPVSETDLLAGLRDLTRAAQSLERFLSHMPDAEAAIRAMPMDTDHFAFGDAAKVKLAELII